MISIISACGKTTIVFSDWLEYLRNPWVIFGILVWCVIVTAILICCCCCKCCKCCQCCRRGRKKQDSPYDYNSWKSSRAGKSRDEDLLAIYNSAGVDSESNVSQGSNENKPGPSAPPAPSPPREPLGYDNQIYIQADEGPYG